MKKLKINHRILHGGIIGLILVIIFLLMLPASPKKFEGVVLVKKPTITWRKTGHGGKVDFKKIQTILVFCSELGTVNAGILNDDPYRTNRDTYPPAQGKTIKVEVSYGELDGEHMPVIQKVWAE